MWWPASVAALGHGWVSICALLAPAMWTSTLPSVFSVTVCISLISLFFVKKKKNPNSRLLSVTTLECLLCLWASSVLDVGKVKQRAVISQAIIVDERSEEERYADNIIWLVLSCNLHPFCPFLLSIIEYYLLKSGSFQKQFTSPHRGDQ